MPLYFSEIEKKYRFRETYYFNGYDFPVDKTLYQHQSDYQLIQVFSSEELLKRALVLDGVIQTTYFDHFRYHCPIVALSVGLCPKPENVLIIGGGDRGVLLEILRRYYFGKVTQVEIDEEVTEVSKRYLPRICGEIPRRKSHRVSELFEDGIEFILESRDLFDVIIVDSSEPIGPGEMLFGQEFYQNALDHLGSGGILITQAGSLIYSKQWLKTFRLLSTTWPGRIYVRVYGINVPTYGGPFALIGVRKGINFPSEGELARMQAQKRQKHNVWISPEMYRAYQTLQPRESSLLQKEIARIKAGRG